MRIAVVMVVVVVLAQPALARGSRRPRQPPEFRYVEEADEDRAEELLAPLLRKYATPQKCAGLLKVLRKGRNYTKAVAATETFDHLCNDAKVREFTHILPSKYRSKKPTGVLLFLHGAVRHTCTERGAFCGASPARSPRRVVVRRRRSSGPSRPVRDLPTTRRSASWSAAQWGCGCCSCPW